MRTETEIDRQYNPDNDLIPGAPAVTWADYQLQQQIHAFEAKVEALTKQIEGLNRTISNLASYEGNY